LVVHDSTGPETERLLNEHPLAAAGQLRHVTLPPGSGPPGLMRNVGWREARAPLIAFTDDDCRPPEEWLERALAAGRRDAGAIVQGKTGPDPDEQNLLSAPWRHTQRITPPKIFAQTCNIVYPREVLERQRGFDEELYTGEDMDLAARARRAGTRYVGADEVLTYHAVVTLSLPRFLRGVWRWKDMPEVIKRNPELRDEFPLWVFWKPTHAWLPLALAAAVLERRNPLFAVLAVPWLVHTLPKHGTDAHGRYRAIAELPGRTAIDLTEMAALLYGSARSRTLFI
jgi:hypothetical protein